MSAVSTARDAIKGSFSSGRLWLVQFLANPILFGLLMVWLRIPESSTWFVILNALLGLFILAAIVALHAGTLNYFYDRYRGEKVLLRSEFRRALRNALPFLICFVVFYLLWGLTARLDAYRYALPNYIRSELSASSRQHTSLQFLVTIYDGFFFALRWVLVPGLFLPFALSTANHEFRGFARKGIRAWKSSVWSFTYWLILTLAALIGVYAAGELANWTSDFTKTTYRHEMASMIVRFFFSYLLALYGWMLACSVVGRQCGQIEQVHPEVARDSRS
jgi:hypothetical protein